MAPKSPEKLQQLQLHNNNTTNNTVVKHSNPFYISAHNLCHNKRLKLKRCKYAEYFRKCLRNRSSSTKFSKTETIRRQKLSLLQAEVTIDLLSDEEEEVEKNQTTTNYPERMCLERAAILGLMPVERSKPKTPTPPPALVPQPLLVPPLVPLLNNANRRLQQITITPEITIPQQASRKRRKSRPQKRNSLPTITNVVSLARPSLPALQPLLLNHESIVLSDDDDNDEPEISITYPTSHNIPCLPPPAPPTPVAAASPSNTMQVDEEVTISLVPRTLTATTTCAPRISKSCTINTTAAIIPANSAPISTAFPMLPDETTVHTVIANRIYELSLTKLREGLASCGIPEFADGQQKISPQRRKGAIQKPPVVSPPQAPISLKLSSDLSISLISDDEDDARQRHNKHEHLLSPAFLQKLPVNVSIAPVPMMMMRPQTNSTDPRKLKLG